MDYNISNSGYYGRTNKSQYSDSGAAQVKQGTIVSLGDTCVLFRIHICVKLF